MPSPARRAHSALSDAAVAQLRRRGRAVSGTPKAHGFVGAQARRYQLPTSVISKALAGATYRHVPEAPVALDYSAARPVNPRSSRGTAIHTARLTDAIVARLRREEAALETAAARAEWLKARAPKYGVTVASLRAAVRGVTWTHVAVPPAVERVRYRPRHVPPQFGITIQKTGVWVRLYPVNGKPQVSRFFPQGVRGGARRALREAIRFRNAELWAGPPETRRRKAPRGRRVSGRKSRPA